jgi:HSP20 family molecular chaperone IbpA
VGVRPPEQTETLKPFEPTMKATLQKETAAAPAERHHPVEFVAPDMNIYETKDGYVLNQGILFLTLPKSEEVKPRKITVSD